MWIIIIALSALLFHSSNALSLGDGIRHITFAKGYIENGLEHANGWQELFFTGYFNTYAVDPWFGAHLSYTPFTFIDNPIIGLKLYSLASIVLLILSFTTILKKYNAPNLYTIALICGCVTFTNRILLGRPLVLYVSLFLLTYSAILHRKYIYLILILALSTLFSHLFIFPVFLCGITTIILWIRERRSDALQCAIYASAGISIGLLLHPQTPAYLHYIYTILISILIGHKHLNVGTELYSGILYPDITLWILIICIASLLFSRQHTQWRKYHIWKNVDTQLTIILCSAFFVAYLKMVRSVEYLYPLLIILVAQLTYSTPHLQQKTASFLKEPFAWNGKIKGIHMCFILCILSFSNTSYDMIEAARYNSLSPYTIIKDIPQGSKVLNIDWWRFTAFYLVNQDLQYARGMDPHFDTRPDDFDGTLDRWIPRYTIAQEGWGSFVRDTKSRITKKGFVLIREAENFNAQSWLDMLKKRYEPEYIVLQNSMHPQLIQALVETGKISIFAQNNHMTILQI